jgi:Na+-transporting methylmalonyl-CoA/oxaloacetate decarboxylase gamma subunit
VNTTLAQALQLTVLGMGMTFASIGVLALGMRLMTWMTREKGRAGTPDGTPVSDEIGTVEMAERSEVDGPPAEAAARAAGAAVAVALANRAPASRGAPQVAAAAVAVALAGHGSAVPQVETTSVDAWDGYVRSAHLSRRARYDARRVRS